MPLEILSTTIVQDGKGKATVELLIADAPEADHVHEMLSLRMETVDSHNFFSGFQGDAMQKAIRILEKLRSELSAKTSNK